MIPVAQKNVSVDETSSSAEYHRLTSRPASLTVAVTLLSCLASCSSPGEVVLDLSTNPVGATVYLSRHGGESYRGKLGPLKTDVGAGAIQEEFLLIGTSPLTHTVRLEEKRSGAVVLGVGGAVMREYRVGILLFEKEGYETVERRVRFHDGRVRVVVELQAEQVESQVEEEEMGAEDVEWQTWE